MFVASERFLSHIIKEYGEHPVSTDGGAPGIPQACKFLKLNHHLHSFVYRMRKALLKEQCST